MIQKKDICVYVNIRIYMYLYMHMYGSYEKDIVDTVHLFSFDRSTSFSVDYLRTVVWSDQPRRKISNDFEIL